VWVLRFTSPCVVGHEQLVFKDSIAACKAQLRGAQNQDYCKEVRKATWRAMERALKAGKCKMIGVSNYPVEVLEEMREYAEIMPAVNQLEHHPRFASTGLVSVAKNMGCVLTGYGLVHAVKIGQSPSSSEGFDDPCAAQLSEVLVGIAKRLGKTEVQVALRWQTQCGVVAIPRSANPAHMLENLQSLGFDLGEGDLSALNKLDQEHPYYWRPNPTRCTVMSADAAALVV
jgi:D-xylose reductase